MGAPASAWLAAGGGLAFFGTRRGAAKRTTLSLAGGVSNGDRTSMPKLRHQRQVRLGKFAAIRRHQPLSLTRSGASPGPTHRVTRRSDRSTPTAAAAEEACCARSAPLLDEKNGAGDGDRTHDIQLGNRFKSHVDRGGQSRKGAGKRGQANDFARKHRAEF